MQSEEAIRLKNKTKPKKKREKKREKESERGERTVLQVAHNHTVFDYIGAHGVWSETMGQQSQQNSENVPFHDASQGRTEFY